MSNQMTDRRSRSSTAVSNAVHRLTLAAGSLGVLSGPAVLVWVGVLCAAVTGPIRAQESKASAPQEAIESTTAAQGSPIVGADGSDGRVAHLGDLTPMGRGTLRSWVRMDETGAPQAVGVTFTDEALEGLPRSTSPGTVSEEYIVDLPAEAKRKTPFDHFGINWNPEGHTPEKVYGVPHFDFHLYMMNPQQRDQITFRGQGMDKIQKKPPAVQIPEDYIYAKKSEVPGMGVHWVDSKAPELHGEPFTHTFIYGSYNGDVTFLEPMVAKKFIEERPNLTTKIKQPEKYPEPGYYPTTYSIRYDPKREEYTVALGDMKRVGRQLVSKK